MLLIPALTFSADGLASGTMSISFERRMRISRGMCLLSHDLANSGVGTNLISALDISVESDAKPTRDNQGWLYGELRNPLYPDKEGAKIVVCVGSCLILAIPTHSRRMTDQATTYLHASRKVSTFQRDRSRSFLVPCTPLFLYARFCLACL